MRNIALYSVYFFQTPARISNYDLELSAWFQRSRTKKHKAIAISLVSGRGRTTSERLWKIQKNLSNHFSSDCCLLTNSFLSVAIDFVFFMMVYSRDALRFSNPGGQAVIW